MRDLTGVLVLALSADAAAVMDFVAHERFALAHADLQLNGQQIDNPQLVDSRILGDAKSSIVHELWSVAALPDGAAESSVTTSLSLARSSGVSTLSVLSEATSSLVWGADADVSFHASQIATESNSFQFFVSSPVRVDLSLDLVFSNRSSPLPPAFDRNRFTLYHTDRDGETEMLSHRANANESLAGSFNLGPGVITVDLWTYASLFYSGYGNGQVVDREFGSIDATIAIRSIPAPGSVPMVSALALAARRRR